MAQTVLIPSVPRVGTITSPTIVIAPNAPPETVFQVTLTIDPSDRVNPAKSFRIECWKTVLGVETLLCAANWDGGPLASIDPTQLAIRRGQIIGVTVFVRLIIPSVLTLGGTIAVI